MPQPFYHRAWELAELNAMTSEKPAAFVLVYGRRRVGKSTLLRKWADASGMPAFYWAAPRGNSDTARADLVRSFWNWLHPGQGDLAPRLSNWPDVFRLLGQAAAGQPLSIILDEFPWLIEADTAMPSYLQHAWDQHLSDTRVKLILSGSHISAMAKLLRSDAPLYRRLTGKLLVEPFIFSELTPFLPRYSPDKRLAVYAMLGGVPDYLLQWDDRKDLKANIQTLFLSRRSTFRGEEEVLLSDVLRRNDPDYRTVLAGVAQGQRDLLDIATAANLPSDRTSAVLEQLIDMHLVENRI
ncbi:MAG: ATP-binding protein, partial [Anaerolineales bacterium]|nr:ATP-binding protein [Anaerolineales bacterium]